MFTELAVTVNTLTVGLAAVTITVALLAPCRVSDLFTFTFSVYVPAATVIVSPFAVVPAAIAACIEENNVSGSSVIFFTGAKLAPPG
jgi:hypothetical protein